MRQTDMATSSLNTETTIALSQSMDSVNTNPEEEVGGSIFYILLKKILFNFPDCLLKNLTTGIKITRTMKQSICNRINFLGRRRNSKPQPQKQWILTNFKSKLSETRNEFRKCLKSDWYFFFKIKSGL